MATLKELRNRVRSLRNTGKITQAMKLVSAAKMKKAQDAITRNRPYSEKMRELIAQVTANAGDVEHPLMQEREVRKVRYYVVTSDRGLCGGFNNGLIRYFVRNQIQSSNREVVGIGKRVADFFRRKGYPISNLAKGLTNEPSFANAQKIAQSAMQDFLSGQVDKVYLVFNHYVSTMTQRPTTVQLLPCAPEVDAGEVAKAGARAKSRSDGYRLDYIFEPEARQLFSELLPKQIQVQVYRVLLENAAGEHGARMTAMDAATNNVRDLINKLTLQMNKARQAAITKELIEIVSGAEAM